MSKFVQLIVGGLEIAGGVLLEVYFPGNPISTYLITAGIGTVVAGVGTLLTAKDQLTGTGGASRNPIAPWLSIYGRARVGGTIIYVNSFGENRAYLDLIMVLACHSCESVDALLFDGQHIQIGAHNSSFTPLQQSVSISSIVRTNGVVIIDLPANIPLLVAGDYALISGVTTDASLNGRFPVSEIISQVVGGPGSISFSYICGGSDVSISTEGTVDTQWPDYGPKIYMESLLGDHSATFSGMLLGTPNDGDAGDLITPDVNPWTAAHKLLGKTCVFLRLHYDDQYFANGLPTISFLVTGKNDISDPRSSPATVGYTNNAALCIADYLANPTYGFRAGYGNDIPIDKLITAASICDEPVALANGGTEPRYTCDGQFHLTMKRGEILQNLLTSCGGRLTYSAGEYVIHPAAWEGVALTIGRPAVSAVMTYVTGHTFGAGYSGIAAASFGSGYAMFSGAAYSTATDTNNWTDSADQWSQPVGPLTTTGNPIDTYIDFLIVGTILGSSSPADVLRVYDCYLDITYPDGSTARFRPTAVRATRGDGQILNPNNTIDGDPSTYAEVTRSSFGGASSSPVLRLYDFVISNSTPGIPDTSASAIEISRDALAQASGSFRWRSKVGIRDLFNGVKGTYISPASNWQMSDIPPYAQDTLHGYASGSPLYQEGDANLAEDGGDRRWLDIQLPFTISTSRAQRLAKIELMRRRQQGAGSFSFNMALYRTTALDVIRMNLPLLGWYGKLLEITAHRLTIDKQHGEATLLGCEIDVQETDPEVYEWDSSEELTPQGFPRPGLPNELGVLDDLYLVNGS